MRQSREQKLKKLCIQNSSFQKFFFNFKKKKKIAKKSEQSILRNLFCFFFAMLFKHLQIET